MPNHPPAVTAEDQLWRSGTTAIALLAISGILLHLVLRFGVGLESKYAEVPLYLVLFLGGLPLIFGLAQKLKRFEFGSDLLAGLSIITSVVLGEYLAGAIVVLMLSGGETLETYAMRSASSVLRALASRLPAVAHRKTDSTIVDVPLDEIAIGDRLVVYPHDICPVDGTVIEGYGVMNEAYLTGEPFEITKAPGSEVISGAVNGESALTIRATRLAIDSRYAKIMHVMHESEQNRPRLRRLGDQLGALYTPVAVAIALLAWVFSGDPLRFLSVLVVATPCPLLIAIPIAIIGSISLAARRSIVIKNPAVLEQVSACRTAIFDKTGTLTYGQPTLTETLGAPGFDATQTLQLVASLERYSKHPLAQAFLDAAQATSLPLLQVDEVSEPPGQGLTGKIGGHIVQVTSRRKAVAEQYPGIDQLPPLSEGLECIVIIDGHYAATYRLRDAPRREGQSFIGHLMPKHRFSRLMIVSGDRESEVRYLGKEVGISEIYAQQSPEEKLALVRQATAEEKTLYVGDGINDAPAMMAATVGMAIGQNSDVTAEAADVVAMGNSLTQIDEFLHISARMRRIVLQSAVGGMLLSVVGMLFASAGLLNPVAGAITQEIIDVLAVVNALRAAYPPKVISDSFSGLES